jgi:uncharacterized protein YjbI with pentapeptide repeats
MTPAVADASRARCSPRIAILDLRGANLRKADLYGADLSGAHLSDANLRRMHGVSHRGPSITDKNGHHAGKGSGTGQCSDMERVISFDGSGIGRGRNRR